MVRPDRVVALFFLAISLGYGYMSWTFELLPFERFIAFRPDTMPLGLAGFGIFFSLAVIVSPGGDDSGLAKDGEGWRTYDWISFFKIITLLICYALTLRPLGYILSTTLFLFLGCFILGERRYIVLIPVAVTGTLFIWFLVDNVLGIFLKPLPAFWG